MIEDIIRISKWQLDSLIGREISNKEFDKMVGVGEKVEVVINDTPVILDRRATMTVVVFVEKDGKIYMYVK